jgi:hypothetical protein
VLLSAVLACLGMLCKETGATILAVCFVHDLFVNSGFAQVGRQGGRAGRQAGRQTGR